ncbi:MAG: 4,5-DOPA dioxygenase extradiol [Myxococcota bacterium]
MLRRPVLFVGHGSPEHGVRDTDYSRAFTELGTQLPKPAAVLAISAHWQTEQRATTANGAPKTIHDFGGFPRDFYEVRYPAPGQPDLAARVAELVGGSPRLDWGLDHGTWSILRWMFPDADVPVVQLSLERGLSAQAHYDLGRKLSPLRDEGVLVVGSGNVVHNLRDAFGRMREGNRDTPAWAASFDRDVAQMLEQRDAKALVAAADHPAFGDAHPTAEHWLPMLYAAGASVGDAEVSFPIAGFDWGSIAMRAVRFDA